jgi:outer membrane protein TolC
VERGYSNLLVAKAQYRAAAAQVAADSALARDAKASTEVGLTLSVAADQADARLHESRRRLRELGYRIEDLSLELADLLGIPPSTSFELVAPPEDSAFTGSLEDYVTGALASNPEVVAATQQVVRAGQGVSAARAEYLPQVGVFAQHLLQHAVPFLPASHFSIGVKAEWTIWDFRQRDFAMAERRAQREQARLDLERTRRRIETETTKAYRAVLRAREGASVAAEAAAARTAAARIAADQVATGTALPSVALSADAARLLAEADLLQARFNIRLAHAALDRVAGHDPR